MTTDWRNMPGPGDPETWGPCTGHPNDPRTEDGTERFEETRDRMIQERMLKVDWFREALSEMDDEATGNLMKLVGANVCKDNADVANFINKIVSVYVEPNDWEVGEQIEMEDEPDDRV